MSRPPAPVERAQRAVAATVVTIGFDDGWADQIQALPILHDHRLRATFYIVSGKIGTPEYMTWQQLREVAAEGHEIGGHSRDHVRLEGMSVTGLRDQICGDRETLVEHGFEPISFAFPFGSFDSDASKVAEDCGYFSARRASGIDGKRVFAESIPPAEPYAVRAAASFRRSTAGAGGDPVTEVESLVENAEERGGGWVHVNFHRVCDACNEFAITPAELDAVLDWLEHRTAHGTIVRTTGEIISQPIVD